MKSPKSFGKLKKPKLIVRRVMGQSMYPALKPGSVVVGHSWFKALRRGDVVIVRHDDLEKIKRIADIRDGRLFLIGDNPEKSTDSRSFGWLSVSVVCAKVIWPRC